MTEPQEGRRARTRFRFGQFDARPNRRCWNHLPGCGGTVLFGPRCRTEPPRGGTFAQCASCQARFVRQRVNGRLRVWEQT